MGFGMDFGRFGKLLSAARVNTPNAPRPGASPIGIDFGVRTLKLLQVQAGDPPTLIAAACLETPTDLLYDPGKRLKFQFEALPKLLKPFKGKRAVCTVPAGQSLVRHLQVPRTEGVPLEAAVELALPLQLGLDPAELICRGVDVGDVGRGGKVEAICFASSRQLVGALMGALRAARLEPVGIQPEFAAALRAFEGLAAGEEAEKPTLYLDLGYGSVKAVVAHGGRMVFARLIECGGLALDEAVGRQLKYELPDANRHRLGLAALTPSAARAAASPAAEEGEGGGLALLRAAMRRDGAEPEAAAAAVAEAEAPAGGGAGPRRFRAPEVDLSESLEALTDEVAMSLRYHASLFPRNPVERAVFVGGEARHAGLCEHVARSLRLPAEVADPTARLARAGNEACVGVDLSCPQPGWAVPLGLCLGPTDL